MKAQPSYNREFPTLPLSRHLQFGAELKWQMPRQPLWDGNVGNTRDVIRQTLACSFCCGQCIRAMGFSARNHAVLYRKGYLPKEIFITIDQYIDIISGTDLTVLARGLRKVRTMFKKSLFVGVIVLLLTFGIWTYAETSNLHRPIKVEDVSRMILWGVGGYKEATQEEVSNIVNWFNSASGIRENKDFVGTTPDSGIIVKEKNGKEFSIIRSGKDFEVQRNDALGKNHSYWAIQKEIKTLLDELSQKK